MISLLLWKDIKRGTLIYQGDEATSMLETLYIGLSDMKYATVSAMTYVRLYHPGPNAPVGQTQHKKMTLRDAQKRD